MKCVHFPVLKCVPGREMVFLFSGGNEKTSQTCQGSEAEKWSWVVEEEGKGCLARAIKQAQERTEVTSCLIPMEHNSFNCTNNRDYNVPFTRLST